MYRNYFIELLIIININILYFLYSKIVQFFSENYIILILD